MLNELSVCGSSNIARTVPTLTRWTTNSRIVISNTHTLLRINYRKWLF